MFFLHNENMSKKCILIHSKSYISNIKTNHTSFFSWNTINIITIQITIMIQYIYIFICIKNYYNSKWKNTLSNNNYKSMNINKSISVLNLA